MASTSRYLNNVAGPAKFASCGYKVRAHVHVGIASTVTPYKMGLLRPIDALDDAAAPKLATILELFSQ